MYLKIVLYLVKIVFWICMGSALKLVCDACWNILESIYLSFSCFFFFFGCCSLNVVNSELKFSESLSWMFNHLILVCVLLSLFRSLCILVLILAHLTWWRSFNCRDSKPRCFEKILHVESKLSSLIFWVEKGKIVMLRWVCLGFLFCRSLKFIEYMLLYPSLIFSSTDLAYYQVLF